MSDTIEDPMVAFVFGGGGRWGAVEVGMVRALLEVGIRPDLIVGSSIGALNGALVASDPTPGGAAELLSMWNVVMQTDVFSGSTIGRVRNLWRHRVALHDLNELESLITHHLPVDSFEDLEVPFECVAACIETAAEHWFGSGPLGPAVLASSAIPGLFPPVEVDGLNYYDGGLVNSVPVDRAVAAGATTVYVLQVGRIEQPLRRPTRIHEPALVAFEIARRHRFATNMASMPSGVEIHLLPSGNPLAFDDRRQLRWRDLSDTEQLIDRAYEATAAYLADRGAG